MFKSGFITIVGRPNVGKSTFLNTVLGQKIAIMSPKAQTTRNKISGIYNRHDAQIVFIDTPGIHKPQHKLGEFMTNTALGATKDVDVILFMASAVDKIGTGDRFVLDNIRGRRTKIVLLLNKIDLLSKEELFKVVSNWHSEFKFDAVFPISALKNDNVDELLNYLVDNLEEGPMFYPSDQISDHPERFIIGELVREKILRLTHEEVPHSVAVTVDKVKKRPNNTIDVLVTIIVERDSQKGIIIGKQGAMIKKIGIDARRDIQNLLGTKVNLETFVKVEKDWRNKNYQLKDLGYKTEDY